MQISALSPKFAYFHCTLNEYQLLCSYLMSGSSDDRWKHGTWRVITGESGLAHTGAIVDNESCNFFVTHDARC